MRKAQGNNAMRNSSGTWIRAIVLIEGVFTLGSGLALLFLPRWFYDSVADFGTYNQHFMGDVGAFSIALGIGLIIAARDPWRYRALIGIGAIGSLIHVANHAYDDFLSGQGVTRHFLLNTLPLLVLAILLALAWYATRERKMDRGTQSAT
jgi:predicted anti-sigma-YlaC factor YlaD